MAHPLEKLIAERKETLESVLHDMRAAEQKMAVLRAEISAFQEALRYISPSEQPKRTRTRSAGKSAPKGHWDKVFKRVGESGKGEITYADIMEIARDEDVAVQDASLRAIMMKYSNEGVFERVKNGVFRLTQKGLEMYPPLEATDEDEEDIFDFEELL